MMGAAVLASRGCMRSGVGLLTAHVSILWFIRSCKYQFLKSMCSVDSSSDCFSVPPPIEKFDAIAVFPV
jgi:NAD(P)H-hydrate epimerase